jgi:hypothetical protein
MGAVLRRHGSFLRFSYWLWERNGAEDPTIEWFRLDGLHGVKKLNVLSPPELCDRSAVEVLSTIESKSIRSTNRMISSGGEK